MPFALSAALVLLPPAPPVVVVDRDDVEVRESCTLVFPRPVADADGDGVVHVVADGVVVDLAGATLDSGLDRAQPDRFAGQGIVVSAKRVTVRNGAVRGFKVAVSGDGCDGGVFERLDLSDNFAQRLRSTKEKEDAADWLYPHDNDRGQQVDAHGAGLSIVGAREVVVREVRARRTQNGIVFRRVDDSKVYDCDCSFLSGWGLAMWRSSRNVVARNSFDFCVRGYSHGVYNRGQDSAGILLFEQCSDNLVALNSATHCGDGVFGFTGREALGEAPCPSSTIDFDDPLAWYRRRGCVGNRFVANDLSYAAAHGLEMTFSFANEIRGNRMVGNAICGIWGGYSQDMVVVGNEFGGNGEGAYGRERGGVNIEHARRARIARNRFEGDRAGVVLWDDEDAHLAKLPWAKANGVRCEENEIAGNRFRAVAVAVELREARATRLSGNRFEDCGAELVEERCEGTVVAEAEAAPDADAARIAELLRGLPGSRVAVGARAHLRGRDRIAMGEFGPLEPPGGDAR
jgi:nitrous oxidase accessory protein NosD